MSNELMIVGILGLSALCLVLLVVGLGIFGIKTRYWNRQDGHSRIVRLEDLGVAELTYTFHEGAPCLKLELNEPNGCTQTAWFDFERTKHGEQSAYELMLTATTQWIRAEAIDMTGRARSALADLGIKSSGVAAND